jgi:hypothetical protein
MTTEKVTINGTDYLLAPINFDQWEQGLFDSKGESLPRARTGFLVASSLANAETPSNPSFESIPAGHIPKLLRTVIKLSDLEGEKQEGEATAPENQG